MNTPAHVVINLVILARGGPSRTQMVVVAGALLPDAPMFVFYFFERVVRKTPEPSSGLEATIRNRGKLFSTSSILRRLLAWGLEWHFLQRPGFGCYFF